MLSTTSTQRAFRTAQYQTHRFPILSLLSSGYPTWEETSLLMPSPKCSLNGLLGRSLTLPPRLLYSSHLCYLELPQRWNWGHFLPQEGSTGVLLVCQQAPKSTNTSKPLPPVPDTLFPPALRTFLCNGSCSQGPVLGAITHHQGQRGTRCKETIAK